MKIISVIMSQKVCQPPPNPKMKQLVGKENITNEIVIVTIKVCAQLFNYCFLVMKTEMCHCSFGEF